MPAARAASSREAPSSTSARASIRRAARASRHRPASRRSSPAPSSRRVTATVMAPLRRSATPPINARRPRMAPRAQRSEAGAVGITRGRPAPCLGRRRRVPLGQGGRGRGAGRSRLREIEFPPRRGRGRGVPVGTTGEAIPLTASSRGADAPGRDTDRDARPSGPRDAAAPAPTAERSGRPTGAAGTGSGSTPQPQSEKALSRP